MATTIVERDIKTALIAGVITKPVPRVMPAPTAMAKPRSASSKADASGTPSPTIAALRPRAQFAHFGRLLVRQVFSFVQVQFAA